MQKEVFGCIGGRPVMKYSFGSDALRVSVLDFGAAVQSLVVNGLDVALGFAHGEDYAVRGGYLGGNIGRTANRIANAAFSLNGRTYHLTKNEGENHLHGGRTGFNRVFYTVEERENGLTMTALSSDGDEGYPGNLTHSVTYLAEGRELRILFEACSDADTLWAPANHTYFNLNGEVGEAGSQRLTVYADAYTPADASLLPLGTAMPVAGTPVDFRVSRPIDDGGAMHGEYDVNFLLRGTHAASLEGDKTGLRMEMYTDLPGLQLYTGFADMGGAEGKTRRYHRFEGIALEAQYVPNAINLSGFAKPVLRAGEKRRHWVTLAFA